MSDKMSRGFHRLALLLAAIPFVIVIVLSVWILIRAIGWVVGGFAAP
jgi:hypothetical protein